GRRVQEGGADQVGRDAIPILDTAFANAGCGELFQFPERNRGRFPVRLQDAAVIHRDGENGHGFGRGTLEVEKIRRSLAVTCVNCLPVDGWRLSQSRRNASRVTTSPCLMPSRSTATPIQ